MKEVSCPACGALTEGETEDAIYQSTLEHTLDAHGYQIPRDHVISSTIEVDSPQS